MKLNLFSTFTILILLSISVNCTRRRKNDKSHAFSGLYPVVFTPFDDDGHINMSVIPAYAKYLHECEVQGVVVGDYVGEGPSLSLSEKKKLFGAWVIAGHPLGLKIIGAVGGTPVIESIELATYAETINIDALFVSPQPYIKYDNPELIADGLKSLSSHVPTLPFFYNYCPEITGLYADMPTLFKIASEKISQFKGIALEVKLAYPITAANKLRKDQNLFISNSVAPAGAVLSGYDAFNLVSLNLFPEIIKDIVKYTRSGDGDRGGEEQKKLNTLLTTITAQGHYVSTQKAAFELISGLHMGKPRLPLRPISRESLQKIEDILEECGYKVHKY